MKRPARTFEPFAVSVPASSANLGPGFDAVGLALELRVHAVVEPVAGEGIVWNFSGGSHAPTHNGLRDEIARGIARILGAEGVPALRIDVRNDIPLGKGLGGSAAGAVLGVAIGARLAPEPPKDVFLAQVVTEIEGHPDNGLPALFGGIVVAAQRVEEAPLFLRFGAPEALQAIVAGPDIAMPTVAARAILPASYARRDAVFNIQRAALLGAALASGRFEMLRTAMGDRIHQPYRASFVPGLEALLNIEHDRVYGVALSGAGPSVIALIERGAADVAEAMRAIFTDHGVASETLTLDLAAAGIVYGEV